MKLQIISTCPSDSFIINNSGGSRIQLVSALQIGGLTPSSTIIRKSLQCVDIPTMVMIRHHNNGFFYQEDQIELFKQEIVRCVDESGVKGIVIGGIRYKQQQQKQEQEQKQGNNTTINNIATNTNINTNNNNNNNRKKKLDKRILQMLQQQQILSNKIDITFHKAFDQIHPSNIMKSYQTLTQFNINRVLTQGGQKPICENTQILKQLVIKNKKDYKNPKILIGGGVTFENVQYLIKQTQAQEIHIGTCVRKNKYGPVIQEKVEEFLKLIN